MSTTNAPQTDCSPSPRIAGFVLAAGEGTRLRPTTCQTPKALVPLCGVRMLELACGQIAPLAPEGTVVNACYHADQVEQAVADLREANGWDLRLSRESRLLDTGGGLRTGARLVPDATHLLIHNADVLLDVDLAELVADHLSSGAAATLALVPGQGPLTVDLDERGKIADFRCPRGTGSFTFAGVHILDMRILEYLATTEVCSIIPAYEAALREGLAVRGWPVRGMWSDIGTPAEWIAAHGALAEHPPTHMSQLRAAVAEQQRRQAALTADGVVCTGALGLGTGVSIPPGTHLHNAIIGDGVALPKPAMVAQTILLENALPPPTATPDPRILACLGKLAEHTRLRPLREQGSARRYARLYCGDRSWVWCKYSLDRAENATAAAANIFLCRLGVPVPALRCHLADARELLLEDLGDLDLLHEPDATEREHALLALMPHLARMHVHGPAAANSAGLPLQPAFDDALYRWEQDYFREHLLENVLRTPQAWTEAVAEEACEVRQWLQAEPVVLIHRDLQAANIMLTEHGPVLIDYQGMRLGCGSYDLASLLYDPYMSHPPELRRRVWEQYRCELRRLGADAPEPNLLHVAAVQRLMQALGAYGKLWLQDGLDWYRPHIRPALALLGEAASAAGCTAIARCAAAAAAGAA